MVTEYRVDVGPLARPRETPQGFLVVEGIASRAGVFEYQRADGSIQRELRLPDDVFAEPALSGYQGATLTKGHPAVPVTAKNATRLSVGTVLEPARRDGDHVRVKMVVQDAGAIAALRSKRMRALSTGYSVDLEEKAGIHPVYGRYDAIQRSLVINHLALCEDGRAGPTAKIRIDAAGKRCAERPDSWKTGWRADAGMMTAAGGAEGEYWSPPGGDDAMGGMGDDDGPAILTTVADGHQHTFEPGDIKAGENNGCTGWATSEGADHPHAHDVIRNADGSYELSMNEGHTHAVTVPDQQQTASASAGSSSGYAAATTTDSRNTHPRGRKMPTPQPQNRNNPGAGAGTGAGRGAAGAQPTQRQQPGRQPSPERQQRTDEDRALMLATATAELARERARADSADQRLAAETARADAAEGAYEATVAKLEAAEAARQDDEEMERKDAEIERLTRLVEDLTSERDDALKPDRLQAAVRERTKIERLAAPVIGLDKDFKIDSLTDRELMVAALARVQDVDLTDKSDDYVRARFDHAMAAHAGGLRALDKIKELLPTTRQDRGTGAAPGAAGSARDKYIANQQNGWKPENHQPVKGA